MKKVLFLSLMLQFFFHISLAQDSSSNSSPPPTTTATSSVSLTPQMSASAVSSLYSVLATSSPQQPGSGPEPGDVGSSSSSVDSNAGASGSDGGSFSLSRGGVIAIIVVATFVCVFGVISAILFYLAKKRDWKIRESIRRSARRVATALTPRSARFPRDVHSRRGLTKIDEVPPTPRRDRSADVEKGNTKQMSFELAEPPKKTRWERKSGR